MSPICLSLQIINLLIISVTVNESSSAGRALCITLLSVTTAFLMMGNEGYSGMQVVRCISANVKLFCLTSFDRPLLDYLIQALQTLLRRKSDISIWPADLSVCYVDPSFTSAHGS